MRSLAFLAALAMASQLAHAQGGGSGAPSALGQTTTPQAASAAERKVETRHEKVAARSQARAAKRAGRAASAGGQ